MNYVICISLFLGIIISPFPKKDSNSNLAPFSILDKHGFYKFAYLEWSPEIGRGHQAALHATYTYDSGRNKKRVPHIGILRLRDMSDTQENIEAVALADRLLSQKPALRDHVMRIFHIDDERKWIYVELIDVEFDSNGEVVKKPTTLEEFLKTNLTSHERIEIVRQILLLFIELWENNPGEENYYFSDMTAKNYLITRKNGKLNLVRIDYVDLRKSEKNHLYPFQLLSVLIQTVLGDSFKDEERFVSLVECLRSHQPSSEKEKAIREILAQPSFVFDDAPTLESSN